MKKQFAFLLSIGLALSSTAFANIEILNPWIRATTGSNAVLFMKIVNTSDAPDKLVSAQSNISQRVEFHGHEEKEGAMNMRKVGFIEVPQKGNKLLTSGGIHLMLIKVNRPLKPGDSAEVTLSFENQGNVQFLAPVKAM